MHGEIAGRHHHDLPARALLEMRHGGPAHGQRPANIDAEEVVPNLVGEFI